MTHPPGDHAFGRPMDETTASPAQRRTQRQHQAVEDGLNPLTMQPKHDQAPDDCTAKDRYLRRYTCGTCAFLLVLNTGRGRTLKCGYGDGQRISYGPATAIRGWWPACQQFEPDSNTFPAAGRRSEPDHASSVPMRMPNTTGAVNP